MARITTLAALAFTGLMIAWAPGASACQGATQPPDTQSVESTRAAVSCLINRERRTRGLRVLRGNAALGSAAQGHSNAMTSQNFFAHEGADGTPASRAAWAGYEKGARTWSVGENLGFGSGALGSAKSIFRAWMRSAAHRQVILMRRWRQIGVGVTFGSPLGPDGQGQATYTVDFGFRRS
jgi:uncharacterized protein YkwD